MNLIWADFLNSEWRDWRGSGYSEDRLDNPEWIPKLLKAAGLSAPVPPGPDDLAALKACRAALRAMAETLAGGGTLSQDHLDLLNRYMAGGPVTRRVAPVEAGLQVEQVPLRQDWSQVMAEMVAAFAATVTAGEGARIRICDNNDCRWVFYDDTRNRTKRFCDDKMCGNLIKVRRFRARQKAGAGQDEA